MELRLAWVSLRMHGDRDLSMQRSVWREVHQILPAVQWLPNRSHSRYDDVKIRPRGSALVLRGEFQCNDDGKFAVLRHEKIIRDLLRFTLLRRVQIPGQVYRSPSNRPHHGHFGFSKSLEKFTRNLRLPERFDLRRLEIRILRHITRSNYAMLAERTTLLGVRRSERLS